MPTVETEGRRVVIQQKDKCLDALSHFKPKESPGVYQCHDSGGNQEWIYDVKTGQVKLSSAKRICLAVDESGSLYNRLCAEVILSYSFLIHFTMIIVSGDQGQVATSPARPFEWDHPSHRHAGILPHPCGQHLLGAHPTKLYQCPEGVPLPAGHALRLNRPAAAVDNQISGLRQDPFYCLDPYSLIMPASGANPSRRIYS